MARYWVERWYENGEAWGGVRWTDTLEEAQIHLAQRTFKTGNQYRIIDTQEKTPEELRNGTDRDGSTG